MLFCCLKTEVRTVLGMYTSYICKSCKKEFILMSLEAQYTIRSGGYIVCPHCSSRALKESKIDDNLQECMRARKYRKEGGVIKQK